MQAVMKKCCLIRVAFGSVTSFFGIKGAFFSKTTRLICAKKIFFRV